jgi:hypothetical protein
LLTPPRASGRMRLSPEQSGDVAVGRSEMAGNGEG